MEDRLEEEVLIEDLPVKKRGKWWMIGLAILVLAVAAWYGFKLWQNHNQKPVTNAYPTTQVRKGNLEVNVSGTGSIQPVNSDTVTSGSQGTIKKVLVKEGDKVKKGDVLATLDLQSISDQITQNEVNLEKDQLDLSQSQDKIKQATDQTTIDNLKITIEKTQLDMKQIREKIASLKDQLQSSDIVAPIGGTIESVSVAAGDSVNGNTTVAQITDYSQMELVTAVDELDIAKVKKDQNATVTIDALPNQTFTGKVTDIANQGQSSNGVATFNVTILLNNIKNIRAGMSAEASILVDSKQNVLMLPIEAVQIIGNKDYVILPSSQADATAGGSTQGFSNRQGNSGQNSQGNNGANSQGNSGQNSQGNNGQRRQGNQSGQSNQNSGASARSNRSTTGTNQAAGGFAARRGNMKEIQVGIHNEDYIEIVSGLKEGDKVVIQVPTATTNQSQMRGMGGIGRMLGGGGSFRGGSSSGGRSRGGN